MLECLNNMRQKMNNENEKQYLNWYYENLKGISKLQARLSWIILILLIFAVLINKQNEVFLKIPLINLEIDVFIIQLVTPLILSLIFWEYLGSMKAAGNAVENIKFRLRNLNYNEKEFHLYDIDTYLTFLDIISFNFRKYINPSKNRDDKKYDWRHLPYLIYVLIFIITKVYILFDYCFGLYINIYFGVLILLDIIFASSVIKNRITRFLKG